MRPAKAPCKSCPYRRDVPSGVWAEEEYAKLPPYDGETFEQAVAGAGGLFMCHQQDGCLCAGWVGCHDMDENLAVRLAAASGKLDAEDVEAIRSYRSPVELFGSGAEAAEHGLARLEDPPIEARRAASRLRRKLDLGEA